MMIIGCEFHTRYQQIAMLDEATGELTERRLDHRSGVYDAGTGYDTSPQVGRCTAAARAGQPLTCRLPHPCGFCRGADFDFASFISPPATLTSLVGPACPYFPTVCPRPTCRAASQHTFTKR